MNIKAEGESRKAEVTAPDSSCVLHGDKFWVECPDCGASGYSGHDCGEDCCCCLDSEDNVRCDLCMGKGGWWRCLTCAPMTEAESEWM